MTDHQPAYDAVYAYIAQLDDVIPNDEIGRNAMIWHAVHAALSAGESQESGTDAPRGSVRPSPIPEFCPACGPGYRYGSEGCRHTPPRGSVQPPEVHRCDALCRDVEDERDQLAAEAERVRPVMEAARALREAQRRDVIDRPTTPNDLFVRAAEFKPLREAFEVAVDTYEEQERGTGE